MRPGWLPIAVVALAAAAATQSSRASAASGPLVVTPEVVGIGLLYRGATVDVRAEVPSGDEAIVSLAANPERLELKSLGKRAGVLWMSVGSVSLERVPPVYQVLTSAPLSRIGPPALLAEYGIGYDAVIPDSAPGSAVRPELIKLKEHEGLYAMREQALDRAGRGGQAESSPLAAEESPAKAAAAGGGVDVMRGTFRLPASAPPGQYSVSLLAFRAGRAVPLSTVPLRLEYVGAARVWRRLAMDHGLAHGVFACVVAIVVGLLTGVLFRPKTDSSH
jgi:hypothetical protein